MTRPQYLAHLTMRQWLDELHRTAESGLILDRLSLPGDVMTDLTQELIAGARRCRLERELAEKIEKLSFLDRPEVAVNKPAVLAARLINGYVAKLGFDRVPAEQRPQVDFEDGTNRPIFLERPPADDLAGLLEVRPAMGNEFVTDWVFAFFRLVEDNTQTMDGLDYDIAQNTRLGELIQSLPEQVAR